MGVLGVKRVKERTEHVCQTFATNHVSAMASKRSP